MNEKRYVILAIDDALLSNFKWNWSTRQNDDRVCQFLDTNCHCCVEIELARLIHQPLRITVLELGFVFDDSQLRPFDQCVDRFLSAGAYVSLNSG